MILNVLVVGMVLMLVTDLLAQANPKDLVGGLGFGLVVGLVVGPRQEPAWVGFVVTSRWLAFRGKLPWKFLGFLDDAHRLVL
jgi:hypothetical protein